MNFLPHWLLYFLASDNRSQIHIVQIFWKEDFFTKGKICFFISFICVIFRILVISCYLLLSLFISLYLFITQTPPTHATLFRYDKVTFETVKQVTVNDVRYYSSVNAAMKSRWVHYSFHLNLNFGIWMPTLL